MEKIATKLNDAINNLVNADRSLIDWDYKPSPEKWSKKEILGHLTDSAMVNIQRFVRCTYEENFKLVYDQVACVKAQNYQQADINDLFNLWSLLNKQIIRIFKNYPADKLQIQCDTGKTTVSLHTVEWLANDYVEHLVHHLKQIVNF